MKYPKSHELLARARGVIPGGINSNIRALWEPHPMFYERGEGSRVWDADGNEFIDYVLGRGPLLLGHSPAPVIDAVVRELRRGLMFAGQSRLEIEAAEAVARHTPCAERVRFTTSGSEAVHAALRLARAATGRQRIIRFESHYHGWFDNIAWSHAPSLEAAGPREQPTPVPVSEGMPPEDGARLIVLPWNDLALVERAFDEHPGQIAAIITEPMLVNGGAIEPLPGYLERLRTLCDRHGTILIFDEVITGFRLSLASAQGYYGVTPDLATFAKALGAGMPVGAFAGRAKLMDRIGELRTMHAGTYNAAPWLMAGVTAAIATLEEDGGAPLRHAIAMAERLRQGWRAAAREAGLSMAVRGVGPLLHVSFVPPGAAPVIDYRSALQADAATGRQLFLALQDRGVRIIPGGLMFVSTAHTEADVEETLAAAVDALAEIAAAC